MTASCWRGLPPPGRGWWRTSALATNTLQTVGARLQETHTRVVEMSTQHVEQRIAHALLRLVKQSGKKVDHGIEIDFPISRQDIAQMTGTTLHTVSRTLSAWEARGLVESSRQKIIVREPHKLFVLAEQTRKPVQPRLSRDRRRCKLQRRQKLIAVDAVLAAGVIDAVKLGDRTTDAAHPEIEEDADGGRPIRHDLADRVERSGHVRFTHALKMRASDSGFFVAAQTRRGFRRLVRIWSGCKGPARPRIDRAPDRAHRNGRKALPPGFALPQRPQGGLATW